MNIKEIKELFRLVEKTDFTGVEIVRGDWKIRVERGTTQIQVPMQPVASPQSQAVSAPPVSAGSTAAAKGGAEEVEEHESGEIIRSPFVGTFYRAPSPETESYVEIGDIIKKGQVLCIVEAMKLMNEIESDVDGKIVDVYPQNGQPVEYGEKIFRIEPK